MDFLQSRVLSWHAMAARMRAIIRGVTLLTVLFCFPMALWGQGSTDKMPEDARISYIRMFLREIEWPATSTHFYIEVLGNDTLFYNAMRRAFRNGKVGGRPIVLSRTNDWYSRTPGVRPDVIYVSESARTNFRQIAQYFKGYPVLILSTGVFDPTEWMVSFGRIATPRTGSVRWVYYLNAAQVASSSNLVLPQRILRSANPGWPPTSPDEIVAAHDRALSGEVKETRSRMSRMGHTVAQQRDTITRQRELLSYLSNPAEAREREAGELVLRRPQGLDSLLGRMQAWRPMWDPAGATFAYQQRAGKRGGWMDTDRWGARSDGWWLLLALLVVATATLYATRAQWRPHPNGIVPIGGDQELLASVSHEIRTPLNAIIGLAQGVLSGATSGEDTSAIIERNASELLRKLNALMALSMLSQSGGVAREAMCLAEFLTERREAVERDAKGAEKDSRLLVRTELDCNLPTSILADTEKLGLVLDTLLANALMHTERGEILFGCRQAPRCMVEFFVFDTGPGMCSEQRDAINRGEPPPPAEGDGPRGIGVGYMLAQGLVRMWGGGMHVDSLPGMGTRAAFTLPLQAV